MKREILTIDPRRAERPLFRKPPRHGRRVAMWLLVLVALAVASGLMLAGDLGLTIPY